MDSSLSVRKLFLACEQTVSELVDPRVAWSCSQFPLLSPLLLAIGRAAVSNPNGVRTFFFGRFVAETGIRCVDVIDGFVFTVVGRHAVE